MSRRDEVADLWDRVTRDFFAGCEPHREDLELRNWFHGYRGRGDGQVQTEALHEPYIGPLASRHGDPRLVTLGLNPGRPDLRFQGRNGIFRTEIESTDSYGDWAVTEPYLRAPWSTSHPRNDYHERLRDFARRWTGDHDVRSREILVFELYPWHSTRVTAAIKAAPELIDRFVWQPLADLNAPLIFAFGNDWAKAAPGLQLIEEAVEQSFTVASRQLKVFRLPSGQRLAVLWQQGYAGPPGPDDLPALRAALAAPGRRTPVPVPAVHEPAPSRCIHDMAPGTCSLCAVKGQKAPGTRSPAVPGRSARARYMAALAETATPALLRLGMGPARLQQGYLPVRWPSGLWFREHTQQNDLHVFVYPERVAVRVHIDAFHGDRGLNDRAFDLVREAVEERLLRELPAGSSTPDWRAAKGGNNQVCEISHPGGIDGGSVSTDAEWVVALTAAWLRALEASPIPDLRRQVERPAGGGAPS